MARHEIVIHENTGATKEVAPYLGSYIAKETLQIPAFATAIGNKCGLPAIQVIAILTGSFEAIQALERESLVRAWTDIGVVCAVITGSFPTADAAFDPARNALELAIRLDETLRLDLADTVPVIVTDADITKLRVDNAMDLEVENPMNLIHGRHVFRVAGLNMVLTGDPDAKAYLKNVLGTTFPLVIDEVVSKQLFKAHTAELLPGGDYKLVVESHAGDAAGPLQTSFRKVKYLRVEDPPATVTLRTMITEGMMDNNIRSGSEPITLEGENLTLGEGDKIYMKLTDDADESYVEVPSSFVKRNTSAAIDLGDDVHDPIWAWIGENCMPTEEHDRITVKLVSHGGVPSSEAQVLTATSVVQFA